MKTLISIIYITARDNYPMMDQYDTHQFKILLDSLVKQTFKDFELIIVDACYQKRILDKPGFDFDFYNKQLLHPVKHIDPSSFSWASKKHLWASQDGLNYGIIHSDGELLLFFGDCCELVNEDSLQLWWDWYQKGYFANGLVIYYKGELPLMVNDEINSTYNDTNGSPLFFKKDRLKALIEGGYIKDIIRDSRWKFVEDEKAKTGVGIYYSYGSQYYGYSSVDIESVLKVNGFDSNFDGDKSLGDVELGLRLERLGCKFVCDEKLWLIEHRHAACSKEVLNGCTGSWRSNYSLMVLNKEKKKITANDYKLSDKELEWIINHGTKWSVPRLEIGTQGYELLMDWFNNPPMFNLRELRNERIKKKTL